MDYSPSPWTSSTEDLNNLYDHVDDLLLNYAHNIVTSSHKLFKNCDKFIILFYLVRILSF